MGINLGYQKLKKKKKAFIEDQIYCVSPSKT